MPQGGGGAVVDRRRRSERNRIVTMLTGIATAIIAVGETGLIPPGWTVAISQAATLAALGVNLWYPR